MTSDAGHIRTASYAARFAAILESFTAQLQRMPEGDALVGALHRVLDEYAIVITKRLEGTLVSTEEALPCTPQDLAQLIPALEARLRTLEVRHFKEAHESVYTERLLKRAEAMLEAYGDPEPGDVLWPVLERRP